MMDAERDISLEIFDLQPYIDHLTSITDPDSISSFKHLPRSHIATVAPH